MNINSFKKRHHKATDDTFTLCSSADSTCKQFEPNSGLVKRQASFGFKLFETPIVFMKENFEKVDFGKISRRQK